MYYMYVKNYKRRKSAAIIKQYSAYETKKYIHRQCLFKVEAILTRFAF